MNLDVENLDLSTWNATKDEMRKKDKYAKVMAATAIVVFLVSSFTTIWAISSIGVILVAVAVVFYYQIHEENKSLVEAFKLSIMSQLVPKLLEDGNFIERSGHDYKSIIESKLLRNYKYISASDTIVGKASGVEFKISTVCAYSHHTQSNGKTSSNYTLYKMRGKWLTAKFHHEFIDNIVLTEKGWDSYIFRSGGHQVEKDHHTAKKIFPGASLSIHAPRDRGLGTVKSLESKDFKSKFDVYSSNEHNAFYLLTPNIMEYLLEVERSNSGKIAFAFEKNELHVAIDETDMMFKLPIRKNFTHDDVHFLLKDVEIAVNIVEQISKINTLFKK